MKVKQEKPKYRPITITLETEQEAEALFDLIDELDNYCTNEDISPPIITQEQRTLIIKLSNARTNCKVII